LKPLPPLSSVVNYNIEGISLPPLSFIFILSHIQLGEKERERKRERETDHSGVCDKGAIDCARCEEETELTKLLERILIFNFSTFFLFSVLKAK